MSVIAGDSLVKESTVLCEALHKTVSATQNFHDCHLTKLLEVSTVRPHLLLHNSLLT